VADVLALAWLRRVDPARPRPYRAFGYPWLPALYVIANLGIALGLAIGSPRSAVVSALVMASALPVYLALRAWRGPLSGSGG